MKLDGISVLVTGGGSGMGRAAASLLAERGARVAVLGRSCEPLESLARANGALPVCADLRDADSLKTALDTIVAQHGCPRIVINAAASGRMFPLVSVDGAISANDDIREVIETNLYGPLLLTRDVASKLAHEPALEDGVRGLVINVSSVGAEDGVVGSTYVASKAAVNGLCLSLARELAPLGIRVVTIAPGAIDTEMYRAGATEATRSLVASTIPLPSRTGKPEEFARLALHVCENDYLNGCVIRLDGGMRIPYTHDVGGKK